MNVYFILILVILIGEYAVSLVVETLNVRNIAVALPQEFEGMYDAHKYASSQRYLKDKTYFSLVEEGFFTAVILIVMLSGTFNLIDSFARAVSANEIIRGLIFTGIILLGGQLLSIPFSAYHTFVIEEKYGFNRTNVKTFVLDIVKTWVIGAVIGSILLSGVIWFFLKTGAHAWFWCWIAVTCFQLFLTFIAPVVILPLFNKFVPLEEGPLKSAIVEYTQKERFSLGGIFTMDASRRTLKSNAFFIGFGRFRRIALFDTLIKNHTTDELVSVLAHEIGHYKKKHFLKGICLSVLTTGLMFFILKIFINNPGLFAAFKVKEVSIYASLVFFSFLYSPINGILSICGGILSRRHEYEADRFAVTTYKKPQDFIAALKKLTVDNLANLTPHPLKVFLDYSHPPVLKRIEAIRRLGSCA